MKNDLSEFIINPKKKDIVEITPDPSILKPYEMMQFNICPVCLGKVKRNQNRYMLEFEIEKIITTKRKKGTYHRKVIQNKVQWFHYEHWTPLEEDKFFDSYSSIIHQKGMPNIIL